MLTPVPILEIFTTQIHHVKHLVLHFTNNVVLMMLHIAILTAQIIFSWTEAVMQLVVILSLPRQAWVLPAIHLVHHPSLISMMTNHAQLSVLSLLKYQLIIIHNINLALIPAIQTQLFYILILHAKAPVILLGYQIQQLAMENSAKVQSL